nr:DNA repair protein RecN [Desulfobacterales bacterium]
MLRELSIRNFAIIDDLQISFSGGLNVLTGETGAGKSIIINAVSLILGSRASTDLIRTSEERAEVEALFELPESTPVASILRDHGIDASDELLIRRVISRNNRHRIYINGRLATTQILISISEKLASISGQHAYQYLLKPGHHLTILDQFAGLERLRNDLHQCYNEILSLVRELSDLKTQEKHKAEHRELLQFQLQEIKRAQITPGEDRLLEEERKKLKNAERLYQTVALCVDSMYETDGDIVGRLKELGNELNELRRIDSSLGPIAEKVIEAGFQLEDCACELRSYLQSIVFDAERIEEVESRLDLLQRLKRKYGGSLESVIAHANAVQKELEGLSACADKIGRVEDGLSRLHKKLCRLAENLSQKRRKAAELLVPKVQAELSSLGMDKVRFAVHFSRIPRDDSIDSYLTWGDSAIDATGADRVAFLIAPNPGEEPKSLDRIASGGELSRIVLALKVILANIGSVETVIFDEVDSGIGGGLAEVVGKKLKGLSRFHQVICITHLPQIAAFADTHFKVSKEVVDGRTRTRITPLEGNDRAIEVARMLGGVRITKKTLEHAREMIQTY